MSRHNTDEGLIFTNPAVQNTTAFSAILSAYILPDAQPSFINTVENALYPATTGNQTLDYNTTTARLSALLADQLLNYNVQAPMSTFNPNISRSYLFQEGPSLHGEEEPYIFFNGGPEEADAYGFGTVNATVAQTLQDWVLEFGAKGDPNAGTVPKIPVYGEQGIMGILANKGVGVG